MTGLAQRIEARAGMWLALLILLTLIVRGAAAIILAQPVESDAAAYLAMADNLVRQGAPTDIHGNHAFYSIGYPLLLAPFVAVMGAQMPAAIALNLLLAALSATLVWRIAGQLGLPVWARLLAVAGHALWIPGIWNASGAARENLSTPLLLFVAAEGLALLRGTRGAALSAGLGWGAGILAGGSSLLIGAAPVTALLLRRQPFARGMAVLIGGAALLIAPWLLATTALVGSPVINTNGGFNLYLGHNPAATGRFVSIGDTPAGPRWEAMRRDLGEAGASAALGQEATRWIAANPGRTITLAATTLALFWAPNAPDAADFATSRAVAGLRLIEVAQYLLILALALWGLWRWGFATGQRRLLLALVGSFWIIHAATYIIPRYRDPVMPLLIILAAAGLAALAQRREAANG